MTLQNDDAQIETGDCKYTDADYQSAFFFYKRFVKEERTLMFMKYLVENDKLVPINKIAQDLFNGDYTEIPTYDLDKMVNGEILQKEIRSNGPEVAMYKINDQFKNMIKLSIRLCDEDDTFDF